MKANELHPDQTIGRTHHEQVFALSTPTKRQSDSPFELEENGALERCARPSHSYMLRSLRVYRGASSERCAGFYPDRDTSRRWGVTRDVRPLLCRKHLPKVPPTVPRSAGVDDRPHV